MEKLRLESSWLANEFRLSDARFYRKAMSLELKMRKLRPRPASISFYPVSAPDQILSAAPLARRFFLSMGSKETK